MRKNRAIQKLDKPNLNKLANHTAIAKRGLEDLEKWSELENLKEEMFTLFKANEYNKCIKICRKIKVLDPDMVVVNLIYSVANNRAGNAKRKKKSLQEVR